MTEQSPSSTIGDPVANSTDTIIIGDPVANSTDTIIIGDPVAETIIGLSVGLSLGVPLIAAVLIMTAVITILCVQISRMKNTPTDTYEVMNLSQLSPSSDPNQNLDYAALEPPRLPSHPDTITTDVNAAYASNIKTQPNTAYASNAS